MKSIYQNYLATIVFSMFIIGLFSCTPKKNTSTVYVNAGLKNYFNYQVGSYWVFYDSLNNIYDSICVTNYDDNFELTNNISNENVSIGIYGFYLNSTTDGMEWPIVLGGIKATLFVNDITYRFTENFPFFTGLQSFAGSDPYPISSFTSLIGSNYINNIKYDSVYKLSFSYSNIVYSDTFYINRDGFLIVILNNQYFHRKLYLDRHKIIL